MVYIIFGDVVWESKVKGLKEVLCSEAKGCVLGDGAECLSLLGKGFMRKAPSLWKSMNI